MAYPAWRSLARPQDPLIQIIDKKEEAEELADVVATSAAMDFGGTGAFYSEQLSRSAKNVTGYRIKVSNKAPDFKWYRKNFPKYSTSISETKETKKVPGF